MNCYQSAINKRVTKMSDVDGCILTFPFSERPNGYQLKVLEFVGAPGLHYSGLLGWGRAKHGPRATRGPL